MRLGIIALVMALVALVLMSGGMAVEQTAPTTAGVTVNQFLSVSLSNYPVNFPNMDPGTTKNATLNQGFPLTATIGAESNVNADVKTSANVANFTGPGALAVSNMEWSASTTFPGTDYTTSPASVCASVAPAGTCNIYHQLTIPGGTTAGSYSVGITITATSV